MHGLRLQRGGRRRRADHRFAARAIARHHHEQFCALQRQVPDADRDHLDVFCGGLRPFRLGAFGGAARAGDPARRRHDVPRLQAALQNDSEGRAVLVHAGAAAVPPAADRQGDRALGAGPHAVRARARGGRRAARRCPDLGHGERDGGGADAPDALRGLFGSVRRAAGTRRRDSARVYPRPARKRDRRADHFDGVPRAGLADRNGGLRLAACAAGRERLDLGDGAVHDAVLAVPLAVLDDADDDQKGDAEPQMDRRVVPDPDGMRRCALYGRERGRRAVRRLNPAGRKKAGEGLP